MLLTDLVQDRLESLECSHNNECEVVDDAKRKKALIEAERLADLYKDIKPEPYLAPHKHLFMAPRTK
mgnify:CR=1 FL=1